MNGPGRRAPMTSTISIHKTCPWQQLLVLWTDQKHCEQPVPPETRVEVILRLENAATVTEPGVWMPLPLGILLSQILFCLKADYFVQCTELECLLLLFAACSWRCHSIWTWTSAFPWHGLFCTFAHSWFSSVSHIKLVNEVQLPFISCTCPVQGNDIKVRILFALTDG